jgi:hypothetical protein
VQRLVDEIVHAQAEHVRRIEAGFAFEAELRPRVARAHAIIEHLVAELDAGLELYAFGDIERFEGGERGAELFSHGLELLLFCGEEITIVLGAIEINLGGGVEGGDRAVKRFAHYADGDIGACDHKKSLRCAVCCILYQLQRMCGGMSSWSTSAACSRGGSVEIARQGGDGRAAR